MRSKNFNFWIIIILAVISITACKRNEIEFADGPFEPTWESLKQYETPEWFKDAKFGIYLHWGPTSVPGVDGWYARNMYVEGHRAYNYHVENYGHPSEVGYKDIIPLWKAEKFDPDSLVRLFKKAGARYITPVAVHHDNFDLWNSRHHKWNAVNYGPEKDIIGMWMQAVKKNDLHWGVTTHLARAWSWVQTNKGSDSDGQYAGVPYDGNDPEFESLYLPYDEDNNQQHPLNPPVKWRLEWMRRMVDLIDNYDIDFLYFDGGAPFQGEDEGLSGRKVIAHLYNRSIERHGSLEAVQTLKNIPNHAFFEEGICVEDLERGRMDDKKDLYWQTDDSMGTWFSRKKNEYRDVKDIIHELVDIVSKNGNLLLNVPLYPDGTLDKEGVDFLHTMGEWFDLYGEAIYGTRTYDIYGEGPTEIAGGHFQENNNLVMTSKDVRYTVKGDTTYILLMGWPEQAVTIKEFKPSEQTVLEVMGTDGEAEWEITEDSLLVSIPGSDTLNIYSARGFTCVLRAYEK